MKPTIIIYGATGAVGSATALLLNERGYGLHLVGRDPERLAVMGLELNAGVTAGDVTDPGLFDRVSKDLDGDAGGIVYAVGTINLGSLRKFKTADYVLDFTVNAVGAALAVRSALPRLKKNKRISSIVLFSSVAADKGFAMHASMGMAKGAVNGLTRSLASELAPNIRVNAIAPSITHTPLSEKILSNEIMADAITKQHPLKRLGKAADIARLAAFLISEDADWITGQIIGVDGGRSVLDTRSAN